MTSRRKLTCCVVFVLHRLACSQPLSHVSEAADVSGVVAFSVKVYNPVFGIHCFLSLSPLPQKILAGYFCAGQTLLVVVRLPKDVFRNFVDSWSWN